MATLYTQQSNNVAKTWVLMSVFLCVVVALGWFLSFYYQSEGILYIAVVFSIVMNITSFWYSDKIALSLSHAKEVKREDYIDYWNTVENLSITAGLPMPRLYVIEDLSPNAFATGRDKNHSAVAVTTGLLKLLNKTELEGVIAHELSHIGNRDILLSTVVVVLVGFISILSNIFMRSRLLGGGRSRDREGGAQGVLFVIGIIFIILSPIFSTLLQLAISRKREFLADASGALLTRYPEGLASALKKISNAGIPMMYSNRATAHLFISDPFAKGEVVKTSGLRRLFSTHPPVEERVEALLGNHS